MRRLILFADRLSPQQTGLLLGVVFLVVQSLLLIQTGVFTGLEAEKYIREGGLLAETGGLSDPKFIFYLPVILLTALCHLTGLPLGTVVLVQVLLAALALRCFYEFVLQLTNRFCALMAALLLAVCTPLQMWNFYLYSDSVFISLFIIFLYAMQRWQHRGFRGWMLTAGLLVLLCFSRPAGLLLVPPFLVWLLARRGMTKWYLLRALALAVLLMAGLYMAVTLAYTGGNSDMDALKPFVEEHIICFVPEKPGGAAVTVVHTASPVNDLVYYIRHNPGHFLRLTGRRLLSFFNLTRPHYSQVHNILMILWMVPMYALGLYGISGLLKRRLRIMVFIAALLLLYPLGIALQCDDWHNRFTMVVMPVCIMLAAAGFYRLFYKDISRRPTP